MTANEATASGLALKEFAAHAAHEISNPLNAISINAELSLSLIKLGRVEEATGLLARMVDDCWNCGQQVRTFARLGEAFAQPSAAIALEPLLLDVCDAIARHGRRPLDQFSCVVAPEVPAVLAESYSLSYALTYLGRRLITDAMQQFQIDAQLYDGRVQVRVRCNNVPGTQAGVGSRPLGVSFFERALGSQSISLQWGVDGQPGFELQLPSAA